MMDILSEGHLIMVHPDLAKVIRTAAQAPQPFVVTYGVRTLAAEHAAVASGHSETMHSRHLLNRNGWGCAVDVAALTNGKVNFAPGHEETVFGQIAEQVLASATLLKIKVMWGGADVGAWVDGRPSTFHDWGHFQLEWAQYP